MEDNRYVHFSVNHSENFVNPNNPQIHIQTIESRWNVIKRHLKRKETNITKFMDEYLLEYIFKKTFKDNLFEMFLEKILKIIFFRIS